MIKVFKWKKLPFKVEWRNPWTNTLRTAWFETREKAESFEEAQELIVQRERDLLAKAKKRARNNTPSYTVQEVLDAYLARPDVRSVTRDSNRFHIKPFLQIFGDRKADSLTKDDIRAFQDIERGRGLMQSTINRRLSIIRAACNWAVGEGMLKETPFKGIHFPHAPSRRIDPPTIAELDRLLAIAPEHIRRTILLGLYTGARPGQCELFRLCWDDIMLDSGVINMPCAYKNRMTAARYIPIHGSLLHEIRDWKEKDTSSGSPCPYVIHFHGKQVKRINSTWKKLCKEAGIVRRIRPYDLRHAFATLCMAEGGDIKSIAEIMGHTNYNMLLSVYQHVGNALKIKAVNALPTVQALQKDKK